MRFLMMAAGIFLLFASCKNAKTVRGKDPDPETIFYDYNIWGEEGMEEVTVRLQYRFGGENGPTLILQNQGKVTLDGTPMYVDSARLTGAFYELNKPADLFKGRHTIMFTDKDGKDHKQEFDYLPFSLTSPLGEKIKKAPFTIPLAGVTAPTRLRLVMTDTSFSTKDVNEVLLVKGDELNITDQMLSNLTTGPVNLELYREEEQPVKNGAEARGRIQLTYSLKRQFELVD